MLLFDLLWWGNTLATGFPLFERDTSPLSTKRNQAIAGLISTLAHFLAISALLIIASYRLARLEPPFIPVAFISFPIEITNAEPIAANENNAASTELPPPAQETVIDTTAAAQPPGHEMSLAPYKEEDGELTQSSSPASPLEENGTPYSTDEFIQAQAMLPPTFGRQDVLGLGATGYGIAAFGAGSGAGSGFSASASGAGIGTSRPAGGNKTHEGMMGNNRGPIPIKTVQPLYPKHARQKGMEGKVVLSLLIDRSGRLIDACVLEKAGHGFDEAALEAVRSWTFMPALQDGIPTTCRARITIRFPLQADT